MDTNDAHHNKAEQVPLVHLMMRHMINRIVMMMMMVAMASRGSLDRRCRSCSMPSIAPHAGSDGIL